MSLYVLRACCMNLHFKLHSNPSYCTQKLKAEQPKNEHANLESNMLKLRYLKRGKTIDLLISAIYLYHVCVFDHLAVAVNGCTGHLQPQLHVPLIDRALR